MPEEVVQIFRGGILQNLPKDKVPEGAVIDAFNFTISDGVAKKLRGFVNWYSGTPPTGIPVGLASYPQTGAAPKIILITTQKVYHVVSKTSLVDITGVANLTGNRDNIPTSAFWAPSGTFLFSNYADVPKKWTGTGDIADIAGSPPRMRNMLIWFDHLVGLNIYDGSTRSYGVKWSQVGNFEVWSGTPSAGSFDLKAISTIQAAHILGPYVVVFTLTSVHVLQYVGAPVWVREQPIAYEVGAIGPQAVATDGRLLYFIGEEGLYICNGSEVRPVGKEAIKREIFSQINMSNRHKSIVWYDEMNRKIHFIIPVGLDEEPTWWYSLSLDEGVVSDKRVIRCASTITYQEGAAKRWVDAVGDWLQHNWPWVSQYFLAGTPIRLIATAGGKIYQLDVGETSPADTEVIYGPDGSQVQGPLLWEGWIQTPYHTLQDPTMIEQAGLKYKVVTEFELMCSKEPGIGDYNVELFVGWVDSLEAPVNWYGPININTQYLSRMIAAVPNLKARYFTFKIRLVTGRPLTISGYRIKYQVGGVI